VPLPMTHRPAAVEALLRQAVEKLGGGKSGEAASYTFGLVQGTKLWNSTDRRKAAAKKVIHAVANYFSLGAPAWRTARFSKELGHHTQSSETSRPACIIQQASRETK
jgi:hypothetical protein